MFWPDASGNEALLHWKKKIQLGAVITKSIDMRSIAGLRKAHKRLVAKFDKGQETDGGVTRGLLKAFTEVVETAQFMQLPGVTQRTDEELKAAIALLKKEGMQELPTETCTALVGRRIKAFIKAGNYGALLQVLDPWADGEWDPLHPTVAALPGTTLSKVRQFQNIAFKQVMTPLIAAGAPSEDEVKKYVGQCHELLCQVDQVDLENLEAVVVNECIQVCESLIGLMDVSTGVTHKAPTS
jgi:hypothetical protein